LQRAKKHRWKAAYAAATSEVEALHKQLLAKKKELEGLEGRLKRLETELRLLAAGPGAGGGVRLPAAAVVRKGKLTCTLVKKVSLQSTAAEATTLAVARF
jgi:predicted RNase H-like nuclease (RuvC/YqgF family)